MLGIRGSPLVRRTPSSSSTAGAAANSKQDGMPSTPMEKPSVATNGIHSQTELSNMTVVNKPSVQQPVTSQKANGNMNGAASSTAKHSDHEESHSTTRVARSSETRTKTSRKSESRMQFSKDQQITVLRETVISTRGKFIADFSHVDEEYINSTTTNSLLEFIARERLTHMPHRGSRWDKVLKWAEFFALQISGYSTAVESFIPDNKDAAQLILAASRVLLELGPGNAEALETTFGVFYKLALSLSFFLRHEELLTVNAKIRGDVAHAFNALLNLVREVTVTYYGRIIGISAHGLTLDFNSVFGHQLEVFYGLKNNIVDKMWENALAGNFSVDIRTIRNWLSPRDRTMQTILSDRLTDRSHRAEYSCEWFQRYLLDFSRGQDDVLAITAPSGCGKTVLSGYIVERLQRPLARKNFQTLSYNIETDIPSETSPLAVAKNLLLQLLETNVGNSSLFEALEQAHKRYAGSKDVHGLEKVLWDALHTGMKSIKHKTDHCLMIVVDGIDEASNKEKNAPAIRNELEKLASHNDCVQTIILSTEVVATKAKTQSLQITADHTHNDIRHMTERSLRHYTHFRDQSEHEQEAIVGRLAHAAKGNFLWVTLTVATLKQETSHKGFMEALKAVIEAPKTLSETILTITNSLDFTRSDTSLLLSWLLVSERPLTLAETKCLLTVDLRKDHLMERRSDVQDDITSACGYLVRVQNGVVRIRHSAILEVLKRMQSESKKLLNLATAQTDLVMRLLAYCKITLKKKYEPTFQPMDMVNVNDIFNKHSLLDYAVRYWTAHFPRSKEFKASGTFEFSADFKSLFPSSTYLAMLEWTCWESQTSTLESIAMHNLALKVREQLFTEKHESVLQNLIICGNLYKRLSNVVEAGSCFYRAGHIGKQILSKYNNITMTCTTTFLSITETITVTKRTEFVSCKEELLKYIIEVSKHQHGKTSDNVIRYYKMLAQLYVDIHEEHEAEVIWRELREIIIVRHGKGSEEDTDISEQLTIVLKKGGKQEQVIEYEKNIFESTMDLEVWDARRMKITLELAVSFEARGDYFRSEELYVILWERLVKHCHHHEHHGVEIHVSMIEIALEYVRFLKRRNRHEEAASILICIWTEYEEYEFESETLFLRLKMVGEMMRAVSLLSIAISVFKKCRSWFSSHGKLEYAASCEVLISETTQEIIVTTTSITTVFTSTSTTTATEMIIKEVFESVMSRSIATSEATSISKSLVSYYMKREQWSLAIETTMRSLTLIWRMIVSGGGTCALPRDNGNEAIDLAISLAVCHLRLHHYHEAEEIYLRVYRACFNSCHIHDERLIKTSTILIKLYEEHRHWHKMIEIYQELLTGYRQHLGPSHILTIKTLYTLGYLCSEHGHGNHREYYEEIIAVLNGKPHVCHHDARDAMIILCGSYYEGGHWQKLKNICATLWETWIHHHHEHEFDSDFIQLLYMRYRYVLEHHFHCEYEILRTITTEYRDTCIIIYGAFAAISIKAMIEFAEICIRSEKHYHEAITTYEEVLAKTKTVTTNTTTTSIISTTTITTIKESLTRAYIVVCRHNSASITTLERAIKVLVERFEYLKITFGCAKAETLTILREVVMMYKKLKTQESHSIIMPMLLQTSIEIITKEKHSPTLHEAARTIGAIFITCELIDHGLDIVREMRRQIITGTSTPSSKLGFKFDTSIGRVSYVFLVTFEEVLRGSMTISYSQIMADLLTETILYESYTRCVKSQASVEVIITHVARLRVFLVSHRRMEQVEVLQHHVFEMFLKKWGTSVKTRREIILVFFISLLEEVGQVRREVEIGDAACISSNKKVVTLLERGDYQEAFEVAQCAFQFVHHQRAYHHLQNVGHGFKLSAYMAGRKLKEPSKKLIEQKLHDQMLDLSRTVIHDVLQACKESKINFVRMQLGELNDLVGLLGEQKNYADLEWLLKALWSSREVQKQWSADTIVAIGTRFVQARFLGSKSDKSDAIRLCEDICYNLRRVGGYLDPKTLDMSDLLSQIYTAAGHYREAMGVHEEVLRLAVEGDDGDDNTDDYLSPEMARKHLDLLKRSYQRLHGWDKSKTVYKDIVDRLLAMPEYKGSKDFEGVQSTDKWNAEEKADAMGTFAAPEKWEFVKPEYVTEKGGVWGVPSSPRPGMGAKRAISNWGMASINHLLHSSHEEMPQEKSVSYGNGNGHQKVGTKNGYVSLIL